VTKPELGRFRFDGSQSDCEVDRGEGASSAEGQAAIKHAAEIASGGPDAMMVQVED
jgi:hypothetical protein